MTVESRGTVQVVRCSGSIDADTVSAFKKRMLEIIAQGSAHLVMDFSTLHFIDSMGLGTLISLLRTVRGKNGDIKIASMSDDVKMIFQITRLDRLFDVAPDATGACEKFAR